MSNFAIGLEDSDARYLERVGFACITLKQVPYWARPSHNITVYGGRAPVQAYVYDVTEQAPYVVTLKSTGVDGV